MKQIITAIMLIAAALQTACGANLSSRMYADRTAYAVGDLLTVLIEEQSSVAQDAADSRVKSKGNSLSASIPSATLGAENLWKAFTLPEWSIDAQKDFDAAASKESSDSLSAAITVYITEVQPNGNMLISGDRVVNVDSNLLRFTLTGTVRPDDISRDNQVLSSRIAGASINYRTEGEFASSSKPGILSRLIDWVIPF